MVNDTNRAGEFVAGIEQVGFLIYDCAIRESLYLNCTPFFLDMENRDDLKRHIILLYSGLLGFMIAAQAFFSTGTLRKVPIIPTGAKSSNILYRSCRQERLLERRRGVRASGTDQQSHR